MPIPTDASAPILSKNLFPVVGVGASAGGLDAFKRLLKAIPPDSEMAWILIQHLSPIHESILADLLQQYTPLPVLEISDDLEVSPGHVYVIPHNKIVRASDGILQLFDRNENERSNTIDIFFASLAEIHREQTIGVLFSGTGSDGTVGLKTIRDVNGLTIVQDMDSAAYYQMPQSAIDAGVVEMVVEPSLIPSRLAELVPRLHTQLSEAVPSPTATDGEVFKQILLLLRSRKGIDFTYYRQSTIRRRILRRQAIAHLGTLQNYYLWLLDNKAEQETLFRDMLIPVTAFFRDPETFKVLCEQIFPQLVNARVASEPVRIWIAGCSTGEEAYSMAICIYEFLQDKNAFTKVQIFATDISETAIAQARSGSYAKVSIAGISPDRLQQFFTFSNGRYLVQKFIREMCVFAEQNFLKDPPFAHMDLISCRNVFIYMEPVLQKKALLTFHYALKERGILLLGQSESAAQAADQFQPIAGPEKLFRRKETPAVFMQVINRRDERAFQQANSEPVKAARAVDELTVASDQAIVDWLNPVGVVVNEHFDIVQFRGSTADYLAAPAGKVSHHVLKMAREGLSFELRSMLHQARTTGAPITKHGISMDNVTRSVTIQVLPLSSLTDTHYFVRFSEEEAPVVHTIGDIASDPVSPARRLQLEKELIQLREDMRAVTEDQEAVNEELQSANEELLSGSEELQSINEELQTTKEEVQSTNEELTTLNQELLVRNDQLVDARNYAEAIISTVHESLVVLTSDLRVRSANHAFYTEFGLTPKQAEGMPFLELNGGRWATQPLMGQLQNVLPLHTSFEELEINWVVDGIEQVKLINARQLIDESLQEQLILLAIRDISERKALENQQKFLTNRLQDMIVESPAFAATFMGHDFQLGIINKAFQYLFDERAVKDQRLEKVFPELSDQGLLEQVSNVYTTGQIYVGNEISYLLESAAGSRNIHLNYSLQPVHDEKHQIIGVLMLGYDATGQVKAKKERETQLRMILEATQLISWTTDSSGHLHYLNSRFFDSTGFNSLQPIDWSTFLHPDQIPATENQWKNAQTTGQPIQWEALVKRADGDYRWHMHRAVPAYGEKGQIEHWVGTSTDIHDQKIFAEELERQVKERTRELQQSNEQLQASNEHLKQFASIASHDLQEPLRKIMIFTGVLNRRFSRMLPAEGQEVIGKIKRDAERMSQLIRETLQYSKVLHSKANLVEVDLDLIIRKVLGDLDLMISETGATINYPSPLPAIAAVALQMNQLFYNLLTNALKFYKETEAPVVSITASLIQTSQMPEIFAAQASGQYLEIIVGDNGIGFEQQYADQIFELFERLHSSEEFDGTGIGLALCKQIVAHHRGFIYAISSPNQGAQVHVLLPMSS